MPFKSHASNNYCLCNCSYSVFYWLIDVPFKPCSNIFQRKPFMTADRYSQSAGNGGVGWGIAMHSEPHYKASFPYPSPGNNSLFLFWYSEFSCVWRTSNKQHSCWVFDCNRPYIRMHYDFRPKSISSQTNTILCMYTTSFVALWSFCLCNSKHIIKCKLFFNTCILTRSTHW